VSEPVSGVSARALGCFPPAQQEQVGLPTGGRLPPVAELTDKLLSFQGERRYAVLATHKPGRERWVSASGPVEILHDEEAQSINARIRRRYLTPKALDGPIEAALAASDDVTLRLTPTAWLSWSAEVGESPERWFLAVDA
jgi:hypothetical protein